MKNQSNLVVLVTVLGISQLMCSYVVGQQQQSLFLEGAAAEAEVVATAEGVATAEEIPGGNPRGAFLRTISGVSIRNRNQGSRFIQPVRSIHPNRLISSIRPSYKLIRSEQTRGWDRGFQPSRSIHRNTLINQIRPSYKLISEHTRRSNRGFPFIQPIRSIHPQMLIHPTSRNYKKVSKLIRKQTRKSFRRQFNGRCILNCERKYSTCVSPVCPAQGLLYRNANVCSTVKHCSAKLLKCTRECVYY